MAHNLYFLQFEKNGKEYNPRNNITMKKTFYLHTYDCKGNSVVLSNHPEYYEPTTLFSLCIFMADKIHRYIGLGVTCYAYNIETSSYEIMFDLVPKEKFF